MADRSIAELNEATQLFDDGMTVVYQGNETQKIAGLALKNYARESVLGYAEEAAAIAITDATTAANNAQAAQTAAETAQRAAETAQTAAEAARSNAETAKDDAESAKTGAVTAQNNAQSAALRATAKANSASASAAEAAQSATDAAAALAAIQVPNITVGNTTTLPAGSNATVTRRAGSPNTAPIFDFGIPKGADGTGAGDMLQSTYDPQGKASDIFAYVDSAVSSVTVTTDATPTQGSTNPVQSGGVYTALGGKQNTISDLPTIRSNASTGAAHAGVKSGNPHNVTASETGAIAEPSTKSSGQVLTYNGTAWEAKAPKSPTLYTATFASGSWTTSGGYSTQTKSVTGLKASYTVPPQIDVVMSGTDAAADSATAEAFALVLKADTAANSITLLASEAPSVSFTLNIVVWE